MVKKNKKKRTQKKLKLKVTKDHPADGESLEPMLPGSSTEVYPISETYPISSSDSSIDDQSQRVLAILGVRDEDDAQVNIENLKKYLDFLINEIKMPCIVTGIEDMGCFAWEEYYNFGPGSEKEYKKLKNKYPSFTDKYTLLGFSEDFDDEEGIYVHVERISDKKRFYLTLADLRGVDESSRNAQILDDHAVWFVNFR